MRLRYISSGASDKSIQDVESRVSFPKGRTGANKLMVVVQAGQTFINLAHDRGPGPGNKKLSAHRQGSITFNY